MSSSSLRYDPRAVANLILDMFMHYHPGSPIDKAKLQSLLFLVNARHLSLYKGHSPLKGAFEATPKGPIQPSVAKSFSNTIGYIYTYRARGISLTTGSHYDLDLPSDDKLNDVIKHVLSHAGALSHEQLQAMLCAKGGPWHYIICKIKNREVVTSQIRDDVIVNHYNKMIIGLILK
ncbi:phage-associated protein [Acetobacter pomorum DSM 11825]|uniref:hypothetical protein n=1 Tax=Acetobacter pomorum TaxID=65959 RepID=UPI001177760C|nr:hypothetical protein [Acetobacter pomorum]GBR52835.1 phage-associated protein [Acetobacter pomorum DSM 11825]